MFRRGALISVAAAALLARAGLAAPSPAPVLASSAAGGVVTVQWDISAPAALQYDVYREISGAAAAIGSSLPVTQSSLVDSGLDPLAFCGPAGITYTVWALDSVADSQSASVYLRLPCPPSGLSAAFGPAQASLSWAAPASPTASSYSLYRATFSPVPLAAPLAQGLSLPAHNDGGLGSGDLPLYYAAISVDAFGNSSAALASPAWPLAPGSLSASATGVTGTVALAWQASLSPGITAYTVFRATAPFLSLATAAAYATGTAATVPGGTDGILNYYWAAADIGGAGPGPRSLSASAYLFGPPDPPVLGWSVAPASALVTVTVTAGAGHGYALGAFQIEHNASGTYALARTLPAGVSVTALSLPCEQAVSLRARALDTRGTLSAYSALSVVARPCAPLLAPAPGLTLSAGSLTLAWAAVTWTAGSAAGWSVAKATGPGWADPLTAVVAVLPAASNSWSTPLTAGASAWFRVYGVSASSITSPASAEVGTLPTPLSPAATARSTSAYLSWTGVKSALNLGVEGYRIYKTVTGTTSVAATVTAQGTGREGVTLTGLAANVPLTLTVAAFYGALEGASATAQALIPALAMPAITSMLQSQGGSLSATVAAPDYEGGVPGGLQLLYAPTPALASATLAALSPSAGLITSTAAPAGQLNYYYVLLSSAAGALSPVSPPASALLAVPSLASPSVSLSLTQASRVLLSWPAVPYATEYQVYRATLGLTATAVYNTADTMITTGTNYLDSNAANGQNNLYRVLARAALALPGGAGRVESALSTPQWITPSVRPGPPGRYYLPSGTPLAPQVIAGAYLTATARPAPAQGPAQVDLSWAPAEPGSSLLSSYLLYRGYSAAGLSKVASVPASVTAYADVHQGPGSGLVYGVSALDLLGMEGPLTTQAPLPYAAWGPPSAFNASAGGSSVSLSWAAPALKGTYALSTYALFRRYQAGSDPVLLTLTTATAYIDGSLNTAASTSVQYLAYSVDVLAYAASPATASAVFPAYAGPLALPAPVSGARVEAAVWPGPAASLEWEPAALAEAVSAYVVWRDGGVAATLTSTSYLDTGVSYAALHSYQVQALNAQGAGISGTALPSPYTVLPPAPSGLSMAADVDASGATTPALRLSWADLGVPAVVTGYRVYRSTGAFVSLASALVLTSTVSASFRDEPLPPGTLYTYKVSSLAGGTESAESALVVTLAAAANTSPAAPAALGALRDPLNGGRVALTWTAVPGAQQYWVFRDTAPLGAAPSLSLALAVLPGAVSYTDAAATATAQFYYAVAAGNLLARGPAQALAITVSASPGKVTGLAATAGYTSPNAEVSLAWATLSGAGAATGYAIYRSTVPADFSINPWITETAQAAGPPFVDTAVAAFVGQELYYWVAGYAHVSGPASAMARAVPRGPAAAPQGLQARGLNGAVGLSWESAPPSEGVTAYEVSYLPWSGGGALNQMAPASATTFSLGGLLNGEGVSFSARAFNSAGASPWSLTVGAQANLAGPAPSPLSFRAAVGFVESTTSTVRVILNWSATPANPAGYVLYRATYALGAATASGGQGAPAWLTGLAGSALSLTDAAVSAGQDYHYALSALNAWGLPAGESAPALLGPVRPFSYPGFVSLSSTAGQSRVDLLWTPSALSGSAGLAPTPYRLYRYSAASPIFKGTAPDAGYPLALGATQTAYTDTSVLNDAIYSYMISVVDALGREAPDAAKALSLVPRGPRMPPSVIVGQASDRRVVLQWLAPKSEADAQAKYVVYRRVTSTGESDYGGPLPHLDRVGPTSGQYPQSVSYVVQSLADVDLAASAGSPLFNKRTYCYALAAVNPAGEGPKSQERCFVPYRPLDPGRLNPANSLVQLSVVEKKKVLLSWGATPDQDPNEGYSVTAYRVYRSQDGGSTYTLLTQVAGSSAAGAAYTDPDTVFGATYVYKVVALDGQGNEGLPYRLQTVTLPSAANSVLLFRNAFNPAKGDRLPVQFSLIQPGRTWVKVFTLGGEYVATLFDEEVPNASADQPYLSDKKEWDGANFAGQTVASGVYLVHLESPGYRANARVAVIK